MIDRVEGNSPFTELDENGKAKKEGEEAPASVFLRQTGRFVVDVAVVLVPVVLLVTFVKLPPPALETLGSVAAAIKASPLEQVRASKGDFRTQRGNNNMYHICSGHISYT